MRFIPALILLLSSNIALTAESPAPLPEADVKAVIQAMDAALQKKDIDGALAQIAETAQIRLAISTAQGPQILPLDRKQYREVLATTLSDAIGYRIERKAFLVTPIKEGKALFTDFISETIQTKDKQTRTLSQERMLLERVEGKIKITMLESSVLTTSN